MVLTGIVVRNGSFAIVLALRLPLPPSSPALTLSSTGPVLFGADHVSLVFASGVPAGFSLSSLRSNFLRRIT